jgi:hypothetical protein
MPKTEPHLIRGLDMALELRSWAENVSDAEMRDTFKLGADEIDALRAARDTVGGFWSAASTERDAYRADNERLREKLGNVHRLMCEANDRLADADMEAAWDKIRLAIRIAT